jgi:NO-binding membrane sensor protein with MHYT domain
MKKIFITAIMSCLLFIGLSSMVNMTPPAENYDCQSDCEFLVGSGVFSTHGVCMSACRTCTGPSNSPTTFAVCVCKIAKDHGDLEELGLNFGQCVNYVKSLD